MKKKYRPHSNVFASLVIIITAAAAVLSMICALTLENSSFRTAAYILFVISAALMIYIPLLLRSIKFFVSDELVCVSLGVILRSERRMKADRIEISYIMKTPFSKFTGLNFLVLCTYGKKMMLPFIDINDAREIIAFTERNVQKK